MNPFIIPEISTTKAAVASRRFPLRRAEDLQGIFARMFSRHLGSLQSGRRFEAESILVIGPSGSGKTVETTDLLSRFNASRAMLPCGDPARFVHCILDGKGGWKDLGKKTLHAMGYPVSDKARLTQTTIWERVVFQAKKQGVVGIHYDEAQHILRGKSENERLAILDSFKTLMKSHDWPLMLILSGVPELSGYVKEEPQLFRLMTQVRFEDIQLPTDLQTIHEIVGSYAIESGIEVADDLPSEDFYHRLATAGAFRWGLAINLTVNAVLAAVGSGAQVLEKDHFVEAWVDKTGMHPISTPFTHDRYETMFRKDHPFQASLSV